MRKILVWESHNMISGGQKMTLLVSELMKDSIECVYLIPQKGALSEELDRRGICYYLLGDQSLPAGVKGKSAIYHYAFMTLKAILKGLSVIRKEKPDMIYAPGPAALPWSAICGQIIRKPVIWHLHHVFLDGATKKLLNFFSKWNVVKTIIAVSNCVGEQINNEKSRQKVQVVYNPVDSVFYSKGDARRLSQEIPRLGYTRTDKTIALGHVAIIQETKCQNVVINAVSELRKSGYDAYAILVGGTKNKEDELYLARLKSMVKELCCEEHIYFLGHKNDIPNVLKCIDFLMLPSVEGFPLAGLEANSARVPVICADVGGSLEYVQVSGGGAVFKFNNPQNAAEVIINSRAFYSEMQEKGYAFATKCSISNYRIAIAPIFNYLLK